MSAYICIILAFVAVFLGTPLFLGFGLLMTILAYFFQGIPPQMIAMDLWSNIDSYTLLALPLFIYAGGLMTEGGSSRYLVNFVNSFVRQFRGGLAIVVIISCSFFAAMSGSIIATAAAVGLVMHKMMTEKGYSAPFTGAIIASGATLGPIIPPSIWMIIYCGMAEANVSKMFLAGFLPGILLMLIFIFIVWLLAGKMNIAKEPAATWSERRHVFFTGLPALVAPLIILGGIYGGIFTPTEAGAVACVYSLIIGIFVYKGIDSFEKMKKLSWDAACVTANILILISTAVLLGAIVSRVGIAQAICVFVHGIGLSSLGFLLLFCALLVFFGCFLEALCIMVITVPLLYPTAAALGIDPLHFGIVLMFGLGIGQLTPPLGVTLYTVAKFTNQPSGPIFKEVMPMVVGMILVMILLAMFPKISLWLPKFLM